jgi:hypothetical protein
MHDDFIQGIMFSRSNLVDLRRMSRSERLMYKMLATKHALRSWKVKPAGRTSRSTDFIAVRSGSNRQKDLQSLAARFKSQA